jgi:hypothetical protein
MSFVAYATVKLRVEVLSRSQEKAFKTGVRVRVSLARLKL